MLEQDVQLTRLIVEKLTDLDQRKQKVSWQLTEAQERLDKIESLRSQRSAYETVLERAAALLGRDDLKVEIEEPVDDAELAEGLRSELSVLEAEQGQYLELIDELRQRAPALLEAAAGMAPESLQALFAPPSDQAAQDAAAGDDQAAGNDETEGAAWTSASQTESSVATGADADTAADFDTDAAAEELDSAPDAELDWTPPVFRPAAMMDEPEMATENAEAVAAEEATSADSGSGWNWPASAEDDSETATPVAGADSLGSEDDEESVQWPQLGVEAEAPSISFAATDWDDQDVEVVSRINYEELASESEQTAEPVSNGHYSNGHYSNGSHAHEVLDESETELAADADEGSADADDEVTASPSNYAYVALDHEVEAAAAAHSANGWESETAEESHALANGAAGFIVEAEQGQAFTTVHSELDHSADFSFNPSFAVDHEAQLSGAAEHSQVAVNVIESAADYSSWGTAAPAAEREEDTRERLIRLARFNHTQLGKRVSGEAPVFVIDATAVLERIPHYDRYHLALDESAARDELVRDFSFLANDLNSAFHLVFNDEHTCGFEVDPHIHLEHGDVSSSDPNPGDQRIQEIVLDYIEHEQPVALVTSDPTLQGLFKGENVVVFSLGEFFLT